MNPETVDEIKRHFGVVAEGSDGRIRLVAEGRACVGWSKRFATT